MGKNVQISNKDLSKKKREAIQLLAETDLSYSDIAQRIGVHRNTLYEWRQNKTFLNQVKDYSGKILNEASVKASKTMIDLLQAKSELVRFQAAKEILDKNEMTQKDKLQLKKLEKEIDGKEETTAENNLANALIKIAGGQHEL